MSKIKIVVAGGGLISQVEHIPNLLSLVGKFELIAVADPSEMTRKHIEDTFRVRTVATVDELWSLGAEAIVIGTPDAYHHQIAAAALDRGLNVLCEKPLALSTAEIDDLIARRDAAGKVLQVGFMKRWDPSYEMLVEDVRGLGDRLRFLSVEVNDPDSWPFVEHQAFLRAQDLPQEARADNRTRLKAQAEAAVGRPLDADQLYAYTDSMSSSLIHDLNAVNGLFEAMGIREVEPVSASMFANGRGTNALLKLNGGQAVAHLAHVVVPDLADYSERISLFFDDRRFEIVFPSPYLHHFQTQLTSYRSEGMRLSKTSHRNGYAESFVRELEGFWASIRNGAPVRNTPEEARKDMVMVREFMLLALGDSGGD
jgi:predicted dehydrogenase